jgi:hypothetical protein
MLVFFVRACLATRVNWAFRYILDEDLLSNGVKLMRVGKYAHVTRVL